MTSLSKIEPACSINKPFSMRLKLGYSSIYYFTILSIIFLLSIPFSNFHFNGDQLHYSKAYRLIIDKNMSEAFSIYRSIIFADEPVHFFLVWLGSNSGISKVILMSILNAILALLHFKWLKSRNYSNLYAALITITNYYLFASFFTLERLKIAFIFTLLFLLSNKKSVFKYPYLILAILSHLQILLFMLPILLSNTLTRKISKSTALKFLIFVFFLCIFSLSSENLSDRMFLVDKLIYYYSRDVEIDVLKISFLHVPATLLMIFCSKKKYTAFFYAFQIFVLISALGGDRLNMALYFGFLYFANFQYFLTKTTLIAFAVFFALKSYTYLEMIYLYGG